MKVLVAGGTGAVGSYLVPTLQRLGADVGVMTRSPKKVADLFPHATPVVADFLQPFKLAKVFADFEALFLLVPCVTSEAHEGLTAVQLAKEAGIKRLVYMSVQQNKHSPKHVPHIGAKMLIESVIEQSGVPYTFIRPNVFMQNDYWFRQALQSGVYPQPIGDVGTSSCDVRDIADAATAALMSGECAGRSFTVAGPDVLTGESAAAIWERALGRPVRYGGHEMDRWASGQVSNGQLDWFVYDLKNMYQAWQRNGLIAEQAELDRLCTLIGRDLRTYEDFVGTTASQWASSA